jgi:hypothetical protein
MMMNDNKIKSTPLQTVDSQQMPDTSLISNDTALINQDCSLKLECCQLKHISPLV